MREIWKTQAMNELEMHEARKASIENITDQLRELESELTSIRSPGADSVSVRGGGGAKDGRYLNNIVARDVLMANLKAARRSVRAVEKALSVLDEEEQELLLRFFIKPEKEAVFDFADKFGIDRKTVYYRRESALKKFTIAMYNGM